jgi:AcrR family transcriptional regulator
MMWPNAQTRLTGGPHGMPPEVVRNIQRERLLKATADVVSRKGYAAATVRDLLGESRLSRRTYYDLYTDKEAAYLDLFGEVAEQIEQRVGAGFESGSHAEEQIRLAIEALAAFCVDEPAEACACLVESLAAGQAGREARNGLIERLAALFAPALEEIGPAHSNPDLVARATVGGIFELLYGPLARHDTAWLRDLAGQIGNLPIVPRARR